MNIIVTSSHADKQADRDLQDFLRDSGFPCFPRERRSLKRMMEHYDADGIIVWQNNGPILHVQGEKFFFHPSMARVRLGAFRKLGTMDPLVLACQFEADDRFLDCTMGLGADCIVASYFLPLGSVVGLEASPGIAHVINWGMKNYSCAQEWMMAAIKRISVVNADHLDYMKKLPDGSFDIVYFDPMFRRPLLNSQAISPLRSLADHNPVALESISEACRVAAKRVVLKERQGSAEFERLGFTRLVGSRHNNISFGVIDTR